LECIPTPIIGYALGFSMGLQYDWRKQGKCYLNIESIFIQIDTLWQLFPLVFLPWEWSKISLAGQVLVDLLSALYVNCQMQEFFNQVAKFLTYEGLASLATRAGMGL